MNNSDTYIHPILVYIVSDLHRPRETAESLERNMTKLWRAAQSKGEGINEFDGLRWKTELHVLGHMTACFPPNPNSQCQESRQPGKKNHSA